MNTQLPLTSNRKSKPVVLALDLGASTGWAIGEDCKLVDSGLWRIPKTVVDGERYMHLWQHLESVLAEYSPKVVVVEGMVYAVQQGAHLGAAYRTVVELFAWHHKLRVESVPPSTLKKAATGKGNAKKPQMIKAASRRWGLEVRDDNHADALCLLGAWLDEVV